MMKMRSISMVATIAAISLFAVMLAPSRATPVPPQGAPATAAQLAGAVFVVSHVDLVPDGLAAAQPALQQYAADSRKDPGALRIELLQQSDRGNHFTIVSVWASEKAFDAHLAAAHTKEFRAKIQSALGSPFDERLHHMVQ
jgi:quinol monooxygenase YgiN